MSAEVIEDGMTGFEGITHYKRRREEQGGDALLNGITHYKRRREEQGGDAFLNGITHYKRRREEQGGDALLNGITPYKRYRDERDGWSSDASGLDPKPGDPVRYEVEDGYRNAPGVNGLSDAVMTIEGLSGLFRFPHMGGLEDGIVPSSSESGPAANVSQQVNTLNDLVNKRRAVIVESDVAISALLAQVKDLDGQIAKLADLHRSVSNKGDGASADALDAKATILVKKRATAAKRAVRYAKLRVLATTLARNAKAQAGLVIIAQNAAVSGDKATAAVAAQAFKDIGATTERIHSLRQEQQMNWNTEDNAESGLGDIPAIWASGDIRAELVAIYKKIGAMKKRGASAREVQPLYDRAYNLRRMVEETRGQGLTGILSTIGGGIKSAYNGTKTAVGAVAKAGVSLGKFAACGVLAKPGVAGTIGAVGGTLVAPGAGTATGAMAGGAAGSVLGAACGKGAQGQQAALDAGVDPYLVTGNVMQRPLFGGVRLWHVLASVGGLGAAFVGVKLATRRPMAGLDPYSTYQFTGTPGMDPVMTYGFQGTRKGKKRGGKRGKHKARGVASIENWIADSFR